jgi:hypothetical protein
VHTQSMPAQRTTLPAEVGSQVEAGVRGGWRSALSSTQQQRLQARVCRVQYRCAPAGTLAACALLPSTSAATSLNVTEIALACVPVLE